VQTPPCTKLVWCTLYQKNIKELDKKSNVYNSKSGPDLVVEVCNHTSVNGSYHPETQAIKTGFYCRATNSKAEAKDKAKAEAKAKAKAKALAKARPKPNAMLKPEAKKVTPGTVPKPVIRPVVKAAAPKPVLKRALKTKVK
jgi:hypothetical protein